MISIQKEPLSSTKRRCFCHFNEDDWQKWAYKRFVDKIPTVELMKEAANPYERELISMIALLDLDSETLTNTVGHQAKPTCNLTKCRLFIEQCAATQSTPVPAVDCK